MYLRRVGVFFYKKNWKFFLLQIKMGDSFKPAVSMIFPYFWLIYDFDKFDVKIIHPQDC
jgi:hypothetical protein